MKYPLKLIEWHDAASGNHQWFPEDELSIEGLPYIVQTLGFEVRRAEDHVTLAMCVSNCGQLRDLFTIPLAMIVREQTFRSRLK